ncbi:MAG: DNA translocase FtsK 4TM domain-containing protein [Clostridia bacterium]|nr:DNA translocase FtsK 4TM domain-containing protein [Deltaproteobacteria bacterium]
MANRRKSKSAGSKDTGSNGARAEKSEAKRKSSSSSHSEAVAVILGCLGVITLLSLVSYDARDTSLNASGRAQVGNWIGPGGAYWADFLLQLVGIGAYALGLGSLLAGWRALVRRRVRPGIRETLGVSLLIVSSGTLAHLILTSVHRTYPAGGVAGALLGELLHDRFAMLGAYILAGTFVLLSLALTADGILHGLGLRGASAANDAASHLKAWWAEAQERRKQRTLALADADDADASGTDDITAKPWEWDTDDDEAEATKRGEREKRVKAARARGQKLGVQDAQRERANEKPRRTLKRSESSEPEVTIDATIDFGEEEDFEPHVQAKLEMLENEAPELDAPEIRAAEPAFRGTESKKSVHEAITAIAARAPALPTQAKSLAVPAVVPRAMIDDLWLFLRGR